MRAKKADRTNHATKLQKKSQICKQFETFFSKKCISALLRNILGVKSDYFTGLSVTGQPVRVATYGNRL